ncbi:MAG: transporter substrate-binding domain-containing protein [Bifidobacterium subtile]|nr:transporter substrate-binding domain-containing protein [Bifidobacterium subtile]
MMLLSSTLFIKQKGIWLQFCDFPFQDLMTTHHISSQKREDDMANTTKNHMTKNRLNSTFVFLFSVVVTIVLLVAGCGTPPPPSSSAGSEHLTIKVGALDTYPPMSFQQNGKLTGFEVDLLDAICKDQNMTAKYQVMKFDGLIPALQSKQVDVALTILKKPERTKIVDFSDVYMTSGLVVTVKKSSGINSFSDLRGKKSSAPKGRRPIRWRKRWQANTAQPHRLLPIRTRCIWPSRAGPQMLWS